MRSDNQQDSKQANSKQSDQREVKLLVHPISNSLLVVDPKGFHAPLEALRKTGVSIGPVEVLDPWQIYSQPSDSGERLPE